MIHHILLALGLLLGNRYCNMGSRTSVGPQGIRVVDGLSSGVACYVSPTCPPTSGSFHD